MTDVTGEFLVVHLCAWDGRVLATSVVQFMPVRDRLISVVPPAFTIPVGSEPHHLIVRYPCGGMEWVAWADRSVRPGKESG